MWDVGTTLIIRCVDEPQGLKACRARPIQAYYKPLKPCRLAATSFTPRAKGREPAQVPAARPQQLKLFVVCPPTHSTLWLDAGLHAYTH